MSSGALGPREAPSLGIDMGYEMMETDLQDMGYRPCHQEYDMTDLTMFVVACSYFIKISPKQQVSWLLPSLNDGLSHNLEVQIGE